MLAPQAKVEAFVHGIYAEILQKDSAHLDDDKSFLSLGGDSLLAVFVAARCQDAGYKINVVDVFQAGSVSELSRRICALEPTPPVGIIKKKKSN